ncbi:MAG TPA: DUF6279 family lipoprotein [Nitrospiraceae bacterium]|nr:DUF6279 family lipoprotein [Nitrospiraceae bacterium]
MTYLVTEETKRAGRHRLRTWCAAGLLVLLAGCSLTLTYRYADWIILWQADHYFDLTADQRHDLTVRLTPLLARHRHEAIPQYETFLVQIRQRFERGLTSQDLDWAYATYDRLRADLFDRLVIDGGVFLASVDPRQVRTFEAALQKDYDKAARLVHAPAPERLKKRAQATIDLLEDWLEPLSRDQEAQIREWSLALPDTQQVWLAYRQQLQQELLALLHQPRTPERIAGELRVMLVPLDQHAPQDYQDAGRQMRAAVKTMALAIDQRLTPDQRHHAVTKLQRLIDQLHDLQAE